MATTDLSERLADALLKELGPVDIESLVRLSGGASRETWSFDARRPDGEVVELILRRDPPGSAKGSMGVEADLFRAAAAADVPVPALICASDDPEILGSSFLILERLEGETIPRRVLREPALAEARKGLAEECGRVLARLHRIDPARVPGLARQDELTHYRGVLDALNQPSPTFELAFRWLEQNRPPGGRETVVHGDFRNGNLMVGPDGVRGVLDWELAHLGDPIEDLGWLCTKSWRFGVDLPVGGFGTYDQLIAGYESEGGGPVDRDVLRWWETFGNLKWGVICMMQASAHLSGAVRSVELAAIGRRVCEVEWDLVGLLLPPAATAAATAGPTAGSDAGRGEDDMHGRPTAAELATAVREFLEGDVMSSTQGRVQFHARVAANVMGMLERQLSTGASQAATHAEGLDGLGAASERELAGAIRSGALDDRLADVHRVVARTVHDKLAVANPRYLEGPRPPEG
ncbi:MAG TPA: phosphotransferase family protein [Acidimicrobiales bacterium]|nr:phosphotransferase family protein [Acidimicrobiales bacterium]